MRIRNYLTIEEIKWLMDNSETANEFKAWQIIYLAVLGYKKNEICELLYITRYTVEKWCKLYNESPNKLRR